MDNGQFEIPFASLDALAPRRVFTHPGNAAHPRCRLGVLRGRLRRGYQPERPPVLLPGICEAFGSLPKGLTRVLFLRVPPLSDPVAIGRAAHVLPVHLHWRFVGLPGFPSIWLGLPGGVVLFWTRRRIGCCLPVGRGDQLREKSGCAVLRVRRRPGPRAVRDGFVRGGMQMPRPGDAKLYVSVSRTPGHVSTCFAARCPLAMAPWTVALRPSDCVASPAKKSVASTGAARSLPAWRPPTPA